MKTLNSPQSLEELQRMSLAAEWALRLRDEEPTREEDIDSWLLWCTSDERNQHAFDRAQKLLSLTRHMPLEDIEWRGERPRRRRAGAFAVVAAAAVVLIAITGAILSRATWTGYGIRTSVQAVPISSDPVHTALLPDGSQMDLAAKTIVSIDYTPEQRNIVLQDGEAYFTVQSNKQRPFVVSAGIVRIRAVGTAFNVRRAGGRTVVTVTKGLVEIYQDTGDSATHEPPVRLAVGGQLAWSSSQGNTVMTAVDPTTALGWREGRLEYAGEPLEAVIADINRYSRRPVRIDDAAVKALRFTGTVLTDATDEWLSALPGILPVRLREQGGALVLAHE